MLTFDIDFEKKHVCLNRIRCVYICVIVWTQKKKHQLKFWEKTSSNEEKKTNDLPNVILIIIARGKKDVWWLNSIYIHFEMKREQSTRHGPADFAYCYWPGHWAIQHNQTYNVSFLSLSISLPLPHFVSHCIQMWFLWIKIIRQKKTMNAYDVNLMNDLFDICGCHWPNRKFKQDGDFFSSAEKSEELINFSTLNIFITLDSGLWNFFFE